MRRIVLALAVLLIPTAAWGASYTFSSGNTFSPSSAYIPGTGPPTINDTVLLGSGSGAFNVSLGILSCGTCTINQSSFTISGGTINCPGLVAITSVGAISGTNAATAPVFSNTSGTVAIAQATAVQGGIYYSTVNGSVITSAINAYVLSGGTYLGPLIFPTGTKTTVSNLNAPVFLGSIQFGSSGTPLYSVSTNISASNTLTGGTLNYGGNYNGTTITGTAASILAQTGSNVLNGGWYYTNSSVWTEI